MERLVRFGGDNLTMDDSSVRREAYRPRRASAAPDDDVVITPDRKYQPVAGRLSAAAAGGIMERRNSTPQVVHQRHMPMEPNKFHIPRKTKEKKGELLGNNNVFLFLTLSSNGETGKYPSYGFMVA